MFVLQCLYPNPRVLATVSSGGGSTRRTQGNAATSILMMPTQYEFLMHSILGLAASELIATDASLAEAAMAHRLKSIQAIKRKLAASSQGITYAEGNALIATCFALTFQSVILEDGSKYLRQDNTQPQAYCAPCPSVYCYSFMILENAGAFFPDR